MNKKPRDGQRRGFRFGLRSLLILVALLGPCFVVLKFWLNRPSAAMSLRLTAAGAVIFSDTEFPLDSLEPILRQELQIRRRYGLDAVVVIEPDIEASIADIQVLISLGQDTGFQKIAFKAPRSANDPNQTK